MWGTLADLAVARQREDVPSSSNIPKASQPSAARRSDPIVTDTAVEKACQHGISLVLSAATNDSETDNSNSGKQLIPKESFQETDVENACKERLRLLSAAATDYHIDEKAKTTSSSIAVSGSKLVSRVRGMPSWKRNFNREGDDNKDIIKRKFKPPNTYLQRRSLPTTRKRKALTWTRPELNETKTPRVAGDGPVPSDPPLQALSEAPNDRSRAALETWYRRLNDLYQYKKMYGDCNVPQKYELDPPLGVWVNKQRMEMKFRMEGKKSSLTQDKIDALKTIGFVWARSKGQKAWDQKYKELMDYKAEFGNCLVPTKYEKMPALGRWVSTQRAQYKVFLEGKESPMTEERVKKLSALGFTWNMLKRLNGNDGEEEAECWNC
eukprot:CAMPEP_0194204362 /NCGR_PEP_ID=MMETSP0156-20130528/3909_1 /TAXON_ID=33649 /ORGANISM="Thalassionema nitzschioides, Strain L26-B" /LENGTH=379 /DNA_ID=CAMNT_0038930357 /DNA_START=146 /DNA_END=1285 /DNA_ORIENTATION=+